MFKASFPTGTTTHERISERCGKVAKSESIFEEETNGREMEAIAVPSLRHPC
jgi:hypothetical protein